MCVGFCFGGTFCYGDAPMRRRPTPPRFQPAHTPASNRASWRNRIRRKRICGVTGTRGRMEIAAHLGQRLGLQQCCLRSQPKKQVLPRLWLRSVDSLASAIIATCPKQPMSTRRRACVDNCCYPLGLDTWSPSRTSTAPINVALCRRRSNRQCHPYAVGDIAVHLRPIGVSP
jgi:hypothetical protein